MNSEASLGLLCQSPQVEKYSGRAGRGERWRVSGCCIPGRESFYLLVQAHCKTGERVKKKKKTPEKQSIVFQVELRLSDEIDKMNHAFLKQILKLSQKKYLYSGDREFQPADHLHGCLNRPKLTKFLSGFIHNYIHQKSQLCKQVVLSVIQCK